MSISIDEKVSTSDLTLALVGNPNTGKTTLFNRLTGLRQRVGNYAGVTVERKMGSLVIAEQKFNVIDLPGTYSLSAASADERVVVDVLDGNLKDTERPDIVVCILDATNLRRNLFLALQVADLDIPMVAALNLWDSARKQRIEIDVDLLSERLGIPVVPTSATTGEGVDELIHEIDLAVKNKPKMKRIKWPDRVQGCVEYLRKQIQSDTGHHLNDAEVRRVLFDVESAISDRIEWSKEVREPHLHFAHEELRKAGYNPTACEPMLIYEEIGKILNETVEYPSEYVPTHTESIDRVLTHRVWGMVIFVGMMYLVFESVYAWASPLMDLIESSTGFVQEHFSPVLAGTPVLQSLFNDGIIGGVGGVVIFLPQILVLFLFISLLEDTGYMARAAFLMDKLFSWCGLNGKSFVPMLSGFACAIPGVMATRTIEDRKARLTTILITPLMSCSARLPVYVLLIGAFIEPVYGPGWAGFALFAMHFVGLAVSIPVAFILNKFILKTKPQPFVMEMPPYRVPKVRNILLRMFGAGKAFLIRAGSVILAISIIIWALLYFPRPVEVEEKAKVVFVAEKAKELEKSSEDIEAELAKEDSELSGEFKGVVDGAYIEQSYMGRTGKALQPIFAPAGFDWKITVGVLASFPAREVIVSTMGIIYNLGSDVDEENEGLRETLAKATWDEGPLAGKPVFTIPVVIAIMVFFALCLQCGATVAVIGQELDWKCAVGAFVYMTALAWIASVLVYQVGTRLFS